MSEPVDGSDSAMAATLMWPCSSSPLSRRRNSCFCSSVPMRATGDAVQIFGGYGFVNDYPVEKLMRDARPYEQLPGDERFERVLADPDRTGGA